MKVLNVFFIVLFILSAAVQYNDPDPYVWVPLYLYGAYMCFEALRRRYIPLMYHLGFIVYGGYAVYLFFSSTGVWSWMFDHGAENIAQSMKATKPWIEETREFFGLVLLLIALIANMFWLRKNKTAF
ncbi:MAG TPA: transmembrane 220 family protein [Patescibacteria group bacterium]|nr:transmembrane 220 family protein [Patescibacteria group bacterium]